MFGDGETNLPLDTFLLRDRDGLSKTTMGVIKDKDWSDPAFFAARQHSVFDNNALYPEIPNTSETPSKTIAPVYRCPPSFIWSDDSARCVVDVASIPNVNPDCPEGMDKHIKGFDRCVPNLNDYLKEDAKN